MESARPNRRRKIATVLVAGCLALGAVAGLSQGMTACSGPDKSADAPKARPLTAAEAGTLAGVRLHNYEDQRATVSGVVAGKDPDGKPKDVRFAGWIDWRRSLLYVRTAERKGMPALLIQAMPGIMAIRAEDKPSATAEPPAEPPTGNWRVRPLGLPVPEQPDPLDSLVAVLLQLSATKADNPDLLRDLQTQWLRKDAVDGTAVEVLLGPATIPMKPVATSSPTPTTAASQSPSATKKPGLNPAGVKPTNPSATPSASPTPDPHSLVANGGPVAYWVDGTARVRRIEALLTNDIRARVDFDRTRRPELTAIAAFGGALINPRKVTAAEAKALSVMRRRTQAARGGHFTVNLPLPPARMIFVDGWLDWRTGVAYALAHDLDDDARNVLVHAGRTSVSLRASTDKQPPLPAPRGKWERRSWEDLGVRVPATELDVLLHEALSVGVPGRDDPKALAKSAYRLRLDELNGRPVAVFEIHTAADAASPPGTALMRYWVDPTGVVRRLEIRTRLGFAQLDIDFGKRLPTLPSRV
ncbi:MAG: hypothetical protein HOU81_26000 [Hamadaea sp.]|uniref:hypothetical protein n=1 Tax=Hamadaea sp. TaxID=2024425 RepID=UPI001828F43B|nr:hypothetical protein [Hamadaea sp.]NUR74277.1 hypothetical protein [Hamadaea sp.]NUT21539.1 hypothetical protein [Hamadaea sp.]